MRRFKQQLSNEECIRILKEEPRGVLALQGDDGYPYAVPIDHFYNEEDGKIYFHGSGEGHKIDSVKRSDKASLCVYDKGYQEDGDWALYIKSVIVFGRIRIVEDREKTIDVVRKLGLKYDPDPEHVESEIQRLGHRVTCLELTIEHMTGKRVHEK